MFKFTLILVLFAAVCSAYDPNLRYQYVRDSVGKSHFVDLWTSMRSVLRSSRYDPTYTTTYHLFTRQNPSMSQPLVYNYPSLVANSNFNSERRTIMLIHGWKDSAISDFNGVLVPIFLAVEDVNVIVVDWSTGASPDEYNEVVLNTVSAGKAVAQFIDWLNEIEDYSPEKYHIVGHGFGGHLAGIAGREVNGDIEYITGLDPALAGWEDNPDRFQADDGKYTEAIHTNHGVTGYTKDLAQVDFYPNGGVEMLGCNSDYCDHARSYFYFAESVSSGGFSGRQCEDYVAAITNTCSLPGRLNMGGLYPKHGETGVYILETNYSAPFSQG